MAAIIIKNFPLVMSYLPKVTESKKLQKIFSLLQNPVIFTLLYISAIAAEKIYEPLMSIAAKITSAELYKIVIKGVIQATKTLREQFHARYNFFKYNMFINGVILRRMLDLKEGNSGEFSKMFTIFSTGGSLGSLYLESENLKRHEKGELRLEHRKDNRLIGAQNE